MLETTTAPKIRSHGTAESRNVSSKHWHTSSLLHGSCELRQVRSISKTSCPHMSEHDARGAKVGLEANSVTLLMGRVRVAPMRT